MAKSTETFAVSKGDSANFFGYADAGQIARSKGKLKLFDADAAKKLEVEAVVAEEEAKTADAAKKVDDTKKTGGADAGAVKKAPAK